VENLDLSSLEAINTAFRKWVGEYNFSRWNKALDRECAAGVYVPSQRRLTSKETELTLAHDEPRKVLKTGSITYYRQYYKFPYDYIGRRVCTRLQGKTLSIEPGNRVIAEYHIKNDRLDQPM